MIHCNMCFPVLCGYASPIDGKWTCPGCKRHYMSPTQKYNLGELLMEDRKNKGLVPAEAKERKALPIVRGVLDYFPLALLEVAHVSKIGNIQHNPGEPLHWDKSKSTDHADCILRHLIDRGRVDADGVRHSSKLAWRALALLQMELEAVGADGADENPPTVAARCVKCLRVFQPGALKYFIQRSNVSGDICEACHQWEQPINDHTEGDPK